jgi:hypothetical protein
MGSIFQFYEWLFDATRAASMSARQANRLLGRIAVALVVFTIAAFALKVIVQPERAARYTPLVVFHAGAMLAWMSLLGTQAYLAASGARTGEGRMGLHRKLGNASITLVAAMLVSGAIISVNIGRELGRPEVTVVNIAAFVTFIPLYFAALHFARTRRMHEHRMSMLIGTLAFMTPVYARVTDVLGLPPQVSIGLQPPLTLAISSGYEWAVLGRFTRSSAAMLTYSIAVVMVMVGVLLVWFV